MEEEYTKYIKEERNDEIITEEPVDIFDYVSCIPREKTDKEQLKDARRELRRTELEKERQSIAINQQTLDIEVLTKILSHTHQDYEEAHARSLHFQERKDYMQQKIWDVERKCQTIIVNSKPVAEGEEESEVVKFAREILEIVEEVL